MLAQSLKYKSKYLVMIPIRFLQNFKIGPVEGLDVSNKKKLQEYIKKGIEDLHKKMLLYDSVRRKSLGL